MTKNLTADEVPEEVIKTLIQTAIKIIKGSKETDAYVYCKDKSGKGSYIAYIFIDNEEKLDGCYFFTDDIIRNYMHLLA